MRDATRSEIEENEDVVRECKAMVEETNTWSQKRRVENFVDNV